jgi:hypothetical protein
LVLLGFYAARTGLRECPLWVKSRHRSAALECPPSAKSEHCEVTLFGCRQRRLPVINKAHAIHFTVFKEGFRIVGVMTRKPTDLDALAAKCQEMAAKATNDRDRQRWVAMSLFWLSQKGRERITAKVASVQPAC